MKEDTPGNNITISRKIHQEPILQYQGKYIRNQYYNMKEDTPGNNITISRKIHQEWILQHEGRYTRKHYYNIKEDTLGINITIWMDTFVHLKLGRKLEKIRVHKSFQKCFINLTFSNCLQIVPSLKYYQIFAKVISFFFNIDWLYRKSKQVDQPLNSSWNYLRSNLNFIE